MREHVTMVTDPNNIGDPFASRAWGVDPEDYSRLAPVGCKGELLLSGPTLACRYLNDDEVANQHSSVEVHSRGHYLAKVDFMPREIL
ncbi:ATP-dependent DNA helicase PIF1 [Metarhizium robertsii ARSEF 23]|uniref:ATP-dependent DNA helicase PIF1 n=1 Tax=Metarhizium robertsii (strain ARSEF 23 / ATCC MYA-3075) TaxID=655844 RepID=A0A0B2XHH3_METRA|nr:ATP-dependent DNA helicase PIF1 [Metarhizium robertsii ARSEF 23]KHO11361.1 ATP-dependent DNA helicase PIF1 [Metarhizium robertsii ARSEF 23]